MLSPELIKALCNAATWSRGNHLKGSGAVRELRLSRTPDEIKIEAKVKGTRRIPYCIEGKYDRKKGVLRTIVCDCPAFLEYSGICKHCVAVLLQCTEQEVFTAERTVSASGSAPAFGTVSASGAVSASGMATASRREQMPRRGHGSANRSGSGGKPVARSTTLELKRLLEQRITQRILLARQQELYGKVRLEPIFFMKGNGCLWNSG